MESRAATSLVRERPVQIQVGETGLAESRRTPPEGCLVIVQPLEGTWLSDRVPAAAVRQSRIEGYSAGAEHLRMSSRALTQFLPGLVDGYGPSLARDAADLVLASGAAHVDVLVARVEGARPWDYHDERVHGALEPFLADMPGTLLVLPDVAGPPDVRHAPRITPEERLARFTAVLQHLGPGLRERYQTALVDMPDLPSSMTEDVLSAAVDRDVALVRFTGSADDRRAQGWHSPSALVAAELLTPRSVSILGLAGRRLRLPEVRRTVRSREVQLRYGYPAIPEGPHAARFLNVRLETGSDTAEVLNEPVFRRPFGGWTLSSMRMVKAVHQQLVDTASQFVFRPANPREALALATAINRSMDPFVQAGLLTGPDGSGTPTISGTVEHTDPTNHSLIADVQGMLKPWSHRVLVRVALRPHSEPELEVR